MSTDPEFARKAADIVGLYLNPPENAVVICVDERSRTSGRWSALKGICACPMDEP